MTAPLVGIVETPATPQPPGNYIVQALATCKKKAEVQKLIDHATKHGYSADGQTQVALRVKLAELST